MQVDKAKVRFLQNSLLRWFRHHARELPWRKDYNSYHVWLSEVMLQQTQMERGVSYFHRWLERFPTIASVAAADIDEILKYWEGLGYYARARNLHRAASQMVEKWGGSVPQSYEDLLSLPGVGPYTASAIASIAFKADIAVVDANVERVFARVFDIDQPLKEKGVHGAICEKARQLLPAGQAREFNQALMDLGGLVCTPKNPQCGICPISSVCQAYQGNFVTDRPVKGKRQQQIVIEMATGLLMVGNRLFIQQRRDDDIWGGLWEFPGGRLKDGESPEQAVIREYAEETGFSVEICKNITTVTHFFTRYKVILHCFVCRLLQESMVPTLTAAQRYHWITSEQLNTYGFPAGHRKFIEFLRENHTGVLQEGC